MGIDALRFITGTISEEPLELSPFTGHDMKMQPFSDLSRWEIGRRFLIFLQSQFGSCGQYGLRRAFEVLATDQGEQWLLVGIRTLGADVEQIMHVANCAVSRLGSARHLSFVIIFLFVE